MVEQVLAGMEKLSNQLNLEFDFSTANHNYEKGIPLENALKDFFRPYFPLKYGFGSGYLVDERKGISKQCDWVIYDALNVSPLFSNRIDTGTEWYPFDGVFGTIEVKRSLTVDQFDKAVEQISSVKKLFRHPNHIFNPHSVIPFENEWLRLNRDAEIPVSNEVYSGIFSFAVGTDKKSKEAFTPEKLLDNLINNYGGIGYEGLPDYIVVNNEYIILKVKLQNKSDKDMIWRYHVYPASERNGFAWLITRENSAGYFFMNLLSQFSMMNLLSTYQLELLNSVSRFMEDNLPNNGELFGGKSPDNSTS